MSFSSLWGWFLIDFSAWLICGKLLKVCGFQRNKRGIFILGGVSIKWGFYLLVLDFSFGGEKIFWSEWAAASGIPNEEGLGLVLLQKND